MSAYRLLAGSVDVALRQYEGKRRALTCGRLALGPHCQGSCCVY